MSIYDLGVLPYQELIQLIGDSDDATIIAGDERHVKSASYDLRLGSDYYLYKEQKVDNSATIKVTNLDETSSSTIIVPPHQAVFVTIHERLNLPSDIVGHLSLKLDLTLKGLMMSAQSQIDAGYKGQLFSLLFNLSDTDITLQKGDEILRLELSRMYTTSDKPYSGLISGKPLRDVLRKHLNSSNASLSQIVNNTKTAVDVKIRRLKLLAGLISLASIIIPIYLTTYGPVNKNENNIIKITEVVHSLKQDVNKLSSEIASLNSGGVGDENIYLNYNALQSLSERLEDNNKKLNDIRNDIEVGSIKENEHLLRLIEELKRKNNDVSLLLNNQRLLEKTNNDLNKLVEFLKKEKLQ